MRSLHVIAGLDIAHGGPSYSVPKLCGGLAQAGVDVELLSVRGADSWTAIENQEPYRERRFPWDYSRVPVLRELRWSSDLARALRDTMQNTEVIHNHGLWLMPNVLAGRMAQTARKPLVISPRGMLAPQALAFSRRKKQVVWRLLQGPAIRGAACFHATSKEEYAEIRGFGLSHPVAIIPNGIDLPEAGAGSPQASIERIVLSLGRLHPKKGLASLIRAWAKIEHNHPGWRLRVVGPSESDYRSELTGLVSSLGVVAATIEGPLYGEQKHRAFREAELFVLPSLNENFGLTAAEALASGTPVIATKGTPWDRLEAERCGWWVDSGVGPLADALEQAMTMSRESLRIMGGKGREWMARDFSWDRVADEMLALYRWVVGGDEVPSAVRLD
ncbi:MAG TPA: glycosyltransferase [Xanthobacteraceae bacterium]|nr:glycosyltransferase [Xanthobacteraceae bacterium]